MNLQSILSANEISECFENVRISLKVVNFQMLTYKHGFTSFVSMYYT